MENNPASLDFRFFVSTNARHNSGLLPSLRVKGMGGGGGLANISERAFEWPAHLLHAHACQFAIPT